MFSRRDAALLVESRGDVLKEQMNARDRTFVRADAGAHHTMAQEDYAPDDKGKGKNKKKKKANPDDRDSECYIEGYVVRYQVTAAGGMQ